MNILQNRDEKLNHANGFYEVLSVMNLLCSCLIENLRYISVQERTAGYVITVALLDVFPKNLLNIRLSTNIRLDDNRLS